MYINGYLIGNCHHFCDRFSGGHCSCGGCFYRGEVAVYRAPSESVEVQVVPVPGEQGSTPYVGPNGNWWVDGEDTGNSSIGSLSLPIQSNNLFSS